MFRLPDAWLWDFWLAQDNGEYHLFFLHASRALHDPDRRHLRAAVGHAVSTDLRHWEQVQDALVHGDAPDFDQTATWTGSVIKGPDGTWFMFYTGTTREPDGRLIQQVGVATSPDLHHWTKHPDNPIVTADPRWYEKGGSQPWHDHHWRDPWVLEDPAGDGWHLLITARANHGPDDDRGVIAHATSKDLLHWDVHPPLTQPGAGFGHLEVPQLVTIDGQHLLIFNCLPSEYSGSRRTAGDQGSIWAAPADSPLGPYHVADAVPLTDDHYYVGKLIQDPAGNWIMLAFENRGSEGHFVGALTDPMPISWDNDKPVVKAAPPQGSRRLTVTQT
ncbi:family 43 glycosylhydrolase [Nakamurella sp. GG22]